jgi:carboxymethylenebutenolidase
MTAPASLALAPSSAFDDERQISIAARAAQPTSSEMTIRWDKTKVDGEEMRVYVGLPDRTGPCPGIIVAQHGSGVDESMQDVVHRLHRLGYAVAAPELFHRQPEGIDFMKRLGMLRDDEIIADIGAAIAHLKSIKPDLGPLGVTGFCMGGRVSYLAACAFPEFRAASVFYGGNILKPYGDGPSPLQRSASIGCPVIGFFGAQDTNPSPQDVGTIDAELTRLGKWHEFHSYADAGHAFQSFSNVQRFRPRAARASWGELIAFFDEHLKGGA